MPLAFAALAALGMLAVSTAQLPPMDKEFAGWMRFQARRYTDYREMVFRQKVYAENKRLVEQHNAQYPRKSSYTLSMNRFGDFTADEFAARFGSGSLGVLAAQQQRRRLRERQAQESAPATPSETVTPEAFTPTYTSTPYEFVSVSGTSLPSLPNTPAPSSDPSLDGTPAPTSPPSSPPSAPPTPDPTGPPTPPPTQAPSGPGTAPPTPAPTGPPTPPPTGPPSASCTAASTLPPSAPPPPPSGSSTMAATSAPPPPPPPPSNSPTRTNTPTRTGTPSAPPTSLDWVARGAVNTPVDAGGCGASWAFAAAGAIEGITKIRTGTLPSVSVQEMLDCSYSYGGAGCSGGYLDSGLLYVQNKGGITGASAYPYTGTSGPCSAAGKTNVASFNTIDYIEYESDIALFNAVVQQPVAISIATGNTVFQFYDGGVIDGSNACVGGVTDGALVVGYGHDSSVNLDYFKIKYSFGTTWGEGGYVRIWRNDQVNDYTGICNIYSTPIMPVKGI